MRLILFGSPGSGKGTQAALLAAALETKRISLGDILREEVKKRTSLGNQVKGYMEKGALVPDGLISKVIEEHINNGGFILDGYPRNISQAERLQEIMQKKNNDIDAFIYLDVDETTVINRLSNRRVCKACGANYHLKNMPPKTEGICDTCGRELAQRKDDAPEVIKKRWQVFAEESEKLCSFYRDKGKLITVDGRQDKKTIFEKIKSQLPC
jgi:adenylate kinase